MRINTITKLESLGIPFHKFNIESFIYEVSKGKFQNFENCAIFCYAINHIFENIQFGENELFELVSAAENDVMSIIDLNA